jgi:hypothetical protein
VTKATSGIGIRAKLQWIRAPFGGSKHLPRPKLGMPAYRLNRGPFDLAERRRSRTYQPWGYHGLPVLKAGGGFGSGNGFERGLRPPTALHDGFD